MTTEALAYWTPAQRPSRTKTLHGTRVRLEPLDAARHAEPLYAAAHGPGADPTLWDYLPYGPFADAADYASWVQGEQGRDDPRLYAIFDESTGDPAGVAAYLRIEPDHGVIEIGHIWFGAALQRTPPATEAIYLLARHAFDELGYRRLEWKCNAANVRSRTAAERFGFTYEGTSRQHMVVRGRNRDSAWYSLLDGEWPAARAAFEAWLDPANFDADGAQQRRLQDLRR